MLKTVDLKDSELFVFNLLPASEDSSFGRVGMPTEPYATKGGRFGRLCRDSCFHLRNSKNEANLFVLLW